MVLVGRRVRQLCAVQRDLYSIVKKSPGACGSGFLPVKVPDTVYTVFQESLEHISVCCQIETDALIDRVNDYTYGTVDVEKSIKLCASRSNCAALSADLGTLMGMLILP